MKFRSESGIALRKQALWVEMSSCLKFIPGEVKPQR
jgi:hypothetical protein